MQGLQAKLIISRGGAQAIGLFGGVEIGEFYHFKNSVHSFERCQLLQASRVPREQSHFGDGGCVAYIPSPHSAVLLQVSGSHFGEGERSKLLVSGAAWRREGESRALFSKGYWDSGLVT